jgi:hypothetical protein
MMTTTTTTKPVPKAPAPRGRKKTHAKPAVPREALQAEKVTRQMYSSLTAPDAPKASPMGYIMGASMVLKMLIDQAVQQGEDREALKAQAMSYIQAI